MSLRPTTRNDDVDKEISKVADRAQATLVVARQTIGEGGSSVGDGTVACLLAIAEQLAFANALKVIEIARAAGEFNHTA